MTLGAQQDRVPVIRLFSLKKSVAPRPPDARPLALRRGLFLGAALAFWMLAIIGRLYYLEIIQYVKWLGVEQRQQQSTVEVSPERGAILDRNRQPLAMSLPVDSIFAVPSEIRPQDRAMFSKLLAPILGLSPGNLQGRFEAFRSFCWLARRVPDAVAARVRNLNLKGIYFQKETKRFYPEGDLAAGVMGYVGDDAGLAGLEYGMNSYLAGRPSRVLVDRDAHRQSFSSTEWKGQPGKSLVLTLDGNIQYIAQTVLAETVAKWHAAGGVAVVQDPQTGDILAAANEPTFDPNDYEKSSPESREDRAVSWVYEPGSTFKLITLAAALEEKLTRPDEVIDCQMGSIVLAGHVIHDHERFGDLTVEQILVHSSDVGAIKLALRLGEDRFYRYIRDFGFGSPTGIDLPGEERGLLTPPARWSGISIGEIAMGQGISVTPLQLVSAYSAVARGGVWLEPRMVLDVARDGIHDSLPRQASHRVVSSQTAAMLMHALMEVVEEGTGRSAKPRGYTAGGKTGTAQKIDPSGHYSHTHYVASFIGVAPIGHPALTVLVAIDSPVGAIYGQESAGPAFKEIVEQSLSYLNVPQDDPSKLPQVAASSPAAPPRVSRAGAAGSFLSGAGASGAVPSAQPIQTISWAAPAHDSPAGTVALNAGPLVTVPDFSRMAARPIADLCQKAGLDLSVSGSGLAVEQSPPAGEKVPLGAEIWVRLAR
ncbi:MAG TPA: penicillin-binding transpeptidase domain-containing protein [Terriglobia bacterium]|nr:penicillin-binding transpeptidase domain-containing protein [Terriglobia bacterium]